MLLQETLDEVVTLGVGPRVRKGKIMFFVRCKSVLEGQLEAFLAFGHSVVTDRNLESLPGLFSFHFEDWLVALFEQFDLVAHVDHHEGDSESLGCSID